MSVFLYVLLCYAIMLEHMLMLWNALKKYQNEVTGVRRWNGMRTSNRTCPLFFAKSKLKVENALSARAPTRPNGRVMGHPKNQIGRFWVGETSRKFGHVPFQLWKIVRAMIRVEMARVKNNSPMNIPSSSLKALYRVSIHTLAQLFLGSSTGFGCRAPLLRHPWRG